MQVVDFSHVSQLTAKLPVRGRCRRRRSALLVVLILNWLIPVLLAEGIHSKGCSWLATSPNGQFVFAGICPRTIEEQVQFLRDRFPGRDNEISAIEKDLRDIHRRFPEQGMYRNDGSNLPIWTMSEWQLEGMPTSDGERLVVPGRAADCFDNSLVARVYRSQGTRFDVTLMSMAPLYIPWMLKLSNIKTALAYPDYSDTYLSPAGDTLVVTTMSDDLIEVSLKDGHIIRSTLAKRAAQEFFTSPVGVGLSLLLMVLIGGTTWGIAKLASHMLRQRRSLSLSRS